MPYIHFTEEQKLRANSVDLVEFLRRQGEKLIPSGRDKRLASDHSITVRGREWYWLAGLPAFHSPGIALAVPVPQTDSSNGHMRKSKQSPHTNLL